MFLDHINAFTALALIAGLTVLIFLTWRYFFHRGSDCALDKDGLQIRYFYGLLKFKSAYGQIDSVILLSFLEFLFSSLHLRCLVSGLWAITRWPSRVVVIKRKRGVTVEYLVVTPKDAPAFVEQLRLRIKEAATSPA